MYLIQSGPERTGTNYLCYLLNSYSNVVHLSDPPALYVPPEPHRINQLCQYYRQQVLDQKHISQSMHPDGTPFQDIAYENYTGPSRMQYDDTNFVFGIKQVPLFLEKLPEFLEHESENVYCMTIRNPIDQIASYIGTKEGAHDYKKQTDILVKYLDHIRLLRYHETVNDPQSAVSYCLQPFIDKGYNIGQPVRERGSSHNSRKHRHKFSEEDLNYIEYWCRENAEILGVWDK